VVLGGRHHAAAELCHLSCVSPIALPAHLGFRCFEVAVFAAMLVLGLMAPRVILGGNLVAALLMLGILYRDQYS